MSVLNWRIWVVLVPLWAGCQAAGPPRDPLFLSKTPIAAKAVFGPPVAIAYSEPSLPRDPFLAKDPPAYADKDPGSVPATLTNRSAHQD